MHTLESLPFTNSFSQLPEYLHGRIQVTPMENVHLASFNPAAAQLIELDPAQAQRKDFADFFNGTRTWPGTDPIAMLYAGHQFGQYVEQLGDGRAILLGEVTNGRGERWELQLKGAGKTPYSRRGDGRAVLRSTLREYLCSEAMHHLGIPSTRSLCMLGSSEEVYREQIETGALLLRMAPSHVRFGSFEVLYYRGQFDYLRQLADYIIHHHYPHLANEPEPVLALYQEVAKRTARLIAQWQLVGFAHGVMNTDNMSILGLTLDYGPFGFLDDYDPGFICNHSDFHGRYAFDRQPDIGLWNLSCLAQALLPLLHEEPEQAVTLAKAGFDLYQDTYEQQYRDGLRQKLGLRENTPRNHALAEHWLRLLHENHCDYTNSFRSLAKLSSHASNEQPPLRDQFIAREAFDHWLGEYRQVLRQEGSEDSARQQAMNAVNPAYVLRNYLAEQAIRKASQGDFSETERLLDIVQKPYEEQAGNEAYASPPPDWGRSLEVSCSS